MPKVSVLMSVYNCENTVKKSIDSIVEQTFTDWELINSFEEKEKLIGYVINRDTGGYISQSGYGYGRYGKYQKYRKYAELDEETMNTEDTL